MNGALSGVELGTLAAVYMGLLLFGIGFNLLTDFVESRGYLKGYTSLFVVFGVGVTLSAVAVVDLAFALITAGAFVFSGLPMIIGSIWRHVRERERQLELLRKAARGDDTA